MKEHGRSKEEIVDKLGQPQEEAKEFEESTVKLISLINDEKKHGNYYNEDDGINVDSNYTDSYVEERYDMKGNRGGRGGSGRGNKQQK